MKSVPELNFLPFDTYTTTLTHTRARARTEQIGWMKSAPMGGRKLEADAFKCHPTDRPLDVYQICGLYTAYLFGMCVCVYDG